MTTKIKTKPRAWTADEVRDMLIEKIRSVADYWAVTNLKRPEFGNMTPEEMVKYRCHGAAFTILSILDGSSPDLPGFDLIPTPHPNDMEYHRENGENWFDPETHISTTLHEFYHKPKMSPSRPLTLIGTCFFTTDAATLNISSCIRWGYEDLKLTKRGRRKLGPSDSSRSPTQILKEPA